MLPNFGALEVKLEKSLTLMEKILIELREIKEVLKEDRPSTDPPPAPLVADPALMTEVIYRGTPLR